MKRHRTIWITGFIVVVGAVLITLTAVAGAATNRNSGVPGSSPQADGLRDLERMRLRAIVDADVATLEALHADDFQLIAPPGFALSRDGYLGGIASGELDFLEFEPISEIVVRLYGNAAVIRYQSHIDVDAAGFGRLAHDAWHTNLYEKRDGQWQVVWEQTTAVGGFPPP